MDCCRRIFCCKRASSGDKVGAEDDDGSRTAPLLAGGDGDPPSTIPDGAGAKGEGEGALGFASPGTDCSDDVDDVALAIGGRGGTTAAETRERIERELRDMAGNARGDYDVAPHDGDLHHWKGYLVGPLGTPYAGGVYFVDVFLPEDYPNRPPVLQFRTPILHPNIDTEGYDSLDLLGDGWTPESTVADVLAAELAMLSHPGFDDTPVDASIAQLLRANPDEYQELVREWTLKYASWGEEYDEAAVRSLIEEGSEEARRRCGPRKGGDGGSAA